MTWTVIPIRDARVTRGTCPEHTFSKSLPWSLHSVNTGMHVFYREQRIQQWMLLRRLEFLQDSNCCHSYGVEDFWKKLPKLQLLLHHLFILCWKRINKKKQTHKFPNVWVMSHFVNNSMVLIMTVSENRGRISFYITRTDMDFLEYTSTNKSRVFLYFV